MTDYKLVPIGPTPEMVEAAEDAYMPFGDMEMAIRMAVLAAPAVQGEPAAWNDPAVAPDGFVLMPRDLTNEMVRAFCMATVLRWDDAPEDQKIEVAKKLQHAFDAVIAAAPQPAEQQPTRACACTVPDDCETLHWRGQILSMNELASVAQPAAGEEIMVNTPGDVYTLPMQPSGLTSGPRFVVHVPAQQPCPEGIREGSPYDDPTFEELCREHEIWGTAAAAQCAAFWEAGKRVAEQQSAPDVAEPTDVRYIDGKGAVRSSPAECHYGISYVTIADTVYWPLSAYAAQLLRSAECGRGDFTGPANECPDASALVEALEAIQKAATHKCIHTGIQAGTALGCIAAICDVALAAHRKQGGEV